VPDYLAQERAFLRTLAERHAVLLLGQEYSPPLLEKVLADLAVVTRTERAADLPSQLLEHVQTADLPNIRRAFSLYGPPDELVELASQPWSFVMTSAIDSIPLEAFRRVTTAGRRLRLLFPGQASGQLTKRSVDSLTVVRLFGSLEEQEERYRPPLRRLNLRQRRSFEVAAVLHQLPELVGPHGSLAVAGLTDHDWLDLDQLALACSRLPPSTVHWFGSGIAPDDEAAFGDALVVHSGTVEDVVRKHAGSPEVEQLQLARSQLASPRSHTVQVGPVVDPTRLVRLTPEEWRNVNQVGILLDDSATQTPNAMSAGEEREAFRSFLRQPQHVPDWEGLARGFIFEREIGASVLAAIEQAASTLGSVREGEADSSGRRGRTASRLATLLTGPPGCGKSRLLHWLAYQLRSRGHVVLYLLTPAGRVHFDSIERVCRILESKGAPVVLVFADGLDDASYMQLNEHLASTGRNALVVGARSSLYPADATSDDPRKQQEFSQYRAVDVPSRLTESEVGRFSDYLTQRGFDEVSPQPASMGDRYFLLLLYRLLPDARGNIHLSLTGEYDKLLSTLDEIQEDDRAEVSNESWREQLQQVASLLFPESAAAQEERSVFAHLEEAVGAVDLCLFCAQIGKPLPLDFLLRIEGGTFLRRYAEFSAALEATALLQEVAVDGAGTTVLDADHPVIAQLTLASVLPRRSDQIGLLQSMVDAVAWDDSAFPGDRPDQDYAVEVLQAVGPRGVAEREFQSPQALEAIVSLLSRIRTEHEADIPKLLLLEANALRLLADRLSTDHATALDRCQQALEVLDRAEEVLSRRRATVARNSELRNVLNTRAVVHGFMIGNNLREYRRLDEPDRSRVRARVFQDLEEVDRLAGRSQGLGSPSFYPLDVTFWAYRDTLEQLVDVTGEEKIRLLERMEEVLDSAVEEPIEANQVSRYQRRAVNLAQLEGDVPLSREMAASMRDRGDFSGECLLVRADAFEPGSRVVKSRAKAKEGLERLESFGRSVYDSREALDLMHHLWMAAFLPDGQIGGPDPVLAACPEEEWLRWRQILQARMRLIGPGQNLFLGFCLSWALFQLDEPRVGLQEIRAVEPLSSGSRRRVGCLVVFTDPDGNAIEYRGSVRRREGDAVVVYVPALLSELRLPPAMTTRFAVLPQVGDEVELEIGLNYRGLLPWRAS
jgi:hypothetical protein